MRIAQTVLDAATRRDPQRELFAQMWFGFMSNGDYARARIVLERLTGSKGESSHDQRIDRSCLT